MNRPPLSNATFAATAFSMPVLPIVVELMREAPTTTFQGGSFLHPL
jgi:hypothetical protein